MLFLGMFTELREVTISCVMSVILLSVCVEQLDYHWVNFHEVWYVRIFQKSIKFKFGFILYMKTYVHI